MSGMEKIEGDFFFRQKNNCFDNRRREYVPVGWKNYARHRKARRSTFVFRKVVISDHSIERKYISSYKDKFF